MGKFVSIGHIVNDLEPSSHIGGSVYYSALTAHKLGFETTIITKAPQDHPYLKQLERLGIKVYLLPSSQNNITSFKNYYNKEGHRTQFVTQKQESITLKDSLPKEILQDSVILVASVIGEVDTNIFPTLSNYGPLFVTFQGYLRQVGEDSKVFKIFPKNLDFLKSVSATIFSDEDINEDLGKLKLVRENSEITVMTQGEKGSTVFKNKQEIYSSALSLETEDIMDLTGAGDTFATAFILEYIKTSDLKLASIKANQMAGLKISEK